MTVSGFTRAATVRGTSTVGAIVLLTLLASSGRLVAQALAPDGTRHLETRADLEAEAQQAEAQHRSGEAWLLRTRLKEGDFQEGDRILLSLQGGNQVIGFPASANQVDTLIVRAGKVVQFPQMTDLSLDGVLRSEVTERIQSHLAEYLRDPVVRVTPLLRIGVLGRVVRQGYYYTSADVLLTDLIMQAGGPAPDGDLRDVTVRRGSDAIWKSGDIRTALSDGLSLDRLHLRAGDEIDVGTQHQFSWIAAAQVAGTLAAVVALLIRFK